MQIHLGRWEGQVPCFSIRLNQEKEQTTQNKQTCLFVWKDEFRRLKTLNYIEDTTSNWIRKGRLWNWNERAEQSKSSLSLN